MCGKTKNPLNREDCFIRLRCDKIRSWNIEKIPNSISTDGAPIQRLALIFSSPDFSYNHLLRQFWTRKKAPKFQCCPCVRPFCNCMLQLIDHCLISSCICCDCKENLFWRFWIFAPLVIFVHVYDEQQKIGTTNIFKRKWWFILKNFLTIKCYDELNRILSMIEIVVC